MTSTQVYSASTGIQFFSVDSVGNLYLPDTTAGVGVLKVTLPSQTSTTFGSITASVTSLCFDNADNLYVTTVDTKIYRITPDGTTTFLINISNGCNGQCVFYNNSIYYVNGANAVYIFDIGTTTITPISSPGFSDVIKMAIDSNGNFYLIADATNTIINKYNSDYTLNTANLITLGGYPASITSNNSSKLYTSFFSGSTTQTDIYNLDGSINTTNIFVPASDFYLFWLVYTNKLYFNDTNFGTISDLYEYSQSGPTPSPPCFKEDSKILTDTGYKAIQDLKKGDLVKTLKHGYKPLVIIGKKDIEHKALNHRAKDQLYKCDQSNYPEITEPLIITGCHSILVDQFVSQEQKEKTIEINGKIYVTDNKYRLPAAADERASVYEVPGTYTIYHIALENDDIYTNYGIYANGLLVETCSKRYLTELSNMELL